jgi:hypothetical protein
MLLFELSQASLKPLFGLSKGPTGVFKSMLDTNRTDGKRRDEIYVDVVEWLAVTFNAARHAISSQMDGSIQVGAVSTNKRGSHTLEYTLPTTMPAWLQSEL